MLNELCAELRNYFDRGMPKYYGDFTISGNKIYHKQTYNEVKMQSGQYFRIIGSVFNDGIYQYPYDDFTDETFHGAVWAMAVPSDVVALSEEIDSWCAKYTGEDSHAMSPFTSESFSGYSYTKVGSGTETASNALPGTWQAAFGNRLNRWRKIR